MCPLLTLRVSLEMHTLLDWGVGERCLCCCCCDGFVAEREGDLDLGERLERR